jgi:hypothetical protein
VKKKRIKEARVVHSLNEDTIALRAKNVDLMIIIG